MEETQLILERHEHQLKTLEQDIYIFTSILLLFLTIIAKKQRMHNNKIPLAFFAECCYTMFIKF